MAQTPKRATAGRPRKNGDDQAETNGRITIKKYANRRLYNTATSSYVTLDHLCQMVKDDLDFVVYDAKSGEDITRSVLTQIIVEEESKGQNMLPISFLRQLISFYGDNLQLVVPRYLEHVMSAFARNQDQTRAYMQEALGGLFPFAQFEEMSRQNMAMLERTMKMFSPYPGADGAAGDEAGTDPSGDMPPPAGTVGPGNPDAIKALQQQMDLLQQRLDALTTDGSKSRG